MSEEPTDPTSKSEPEKLDRILVTAVVGKNIPDNLVKEHVQSIPKIGVAKQAILAHYISRTELKGLLDKYEYDDVRDTPVGSHMKDGRNQLRAELRKELGLK